MSPPTPDSVPFDKMKIKHIESMTEVTVRVKLGDPHVSPYDAEQFAYDEYRGQVKTSPDLIHATRGTASEPVVLTIQGYVCTQHHHSENTIHTHVVSEAQGVFSQFADGEVLHVEAVLGTEHDVDEVKGSEILSQMEAR